MADIQVINFLKLLGNTVNLTALDSVSNPVNWETVFKYAKEHNVTPLIFEKASEIDSFSEYEKYNEIFIRSMNQVAEQTNNTDAFLKLYKVFRENNFYPIVMKGIILREMYGSLADCRPSGDEDILIRKEDFKLADEILRSQGYIPEEDEFTDEQLSGVQEINYNSEDSSFYIELHINPMGTENDLRGRMNECFRKVFTDYEEIEVNGTLLRTMNYTDHFLFIILHAFRHFTASGFGVRQVLDILVYYKKYEDKINFAYIEEKLKEFDSWLFFNDLIHMGNKYMGFELKAFEEPTSVELLLDDLMQSGVFGLETQAHRTACQMTSAAVANKGKKENKLKTFMRTLFPSKEHFINENPEIVEKPWIIVKLWLKRIFKFIRHSAEHDGNLAKESMDISNKRIELLKEYKIL